MPIRAPLMFVFLDPVDKPSAGKSAKARKAVRSYVTAQQHRRRRQEERRASETAKGISREESWRKQGKEPKLEIQGTIPEWIKQEEKDKEQKKGQNLSSDFLVPSTSVDLFNPSIAGIRTGSLAFQLFVLNDPSNDIGSILHELETDALSVMNCYAKLAVSQAISYEQEFIPLTQPGRVKKHVLLGIFQDPALIAACILTSLSEIHESRRCEPRIFNEILRLRGHVIRGINEALSDPARATSDYLIAAVILLAMFEATHGLGDSHPVHMVGVMTMINMRGGLRELGYEGCVEAFVLWQDANIARVVKGKTYSHLAKNPSLVLEAKLATSAPALNDRGGGGGGGGGGEEEEDMSETMA